MKNCMKFSYSPIRHTKKILVIQSNWTKTSLSRGKTAPRNEDLSTFLRSFNIHFK